MSASRLPPPALKWLHKCKTVYDWWVKYEITKEFFQAKVVPGPDYPHLNWSNVFLYNSMNAVCFRSHVAPKTARQSSGISGQYQAISRFVSDGYNLYHSDPVLAEQLALTRCRVRIQKCCMHPVIFKVVINIIQVPVWSVWKKKSKSLWLKRGLVTRSHTIFKYFSSWMGCTSIPECMREFDSWQFVGTHTYLITWKEYELRTFEPKSRKPITRSRVTRSRGLSLKPPFTLPLSL